MADIIWQIWIYVIWLDTKSTPLSWRGRTRIEGPDSIYTMAEMVWQIWIYFIWLEKKSTPWRAASRGGFFFSRVDEFPRPIDVEWTWERGCRWGSGGVGGGGVGAGGGGGLWGGGGGGGGLLLSKTLHSPHLFGQYMPHSVCAVFVCHGVADGLVTHLYSYNERWILKKVYFCKSELGVTTWQTIRHSGRT